MSTEYTPDADAAIESSFFDTIADFEAPATDAPLETTDDALTANATEEAGDAGRTDEQATGEGDDKAAEVQAEATGSPDEKTAVEAKPDDAEAGAETHEEKAARLSFWDHFRSSKPIGDTLDKMRDVSLSRYGEMEDEVLARKLSDVNGFAADLYAKQPEAYGELVVRSYEADPAFWHEKITGREGTDAAGIRAALDFHARYKDQIPAAKDFALTEEMEDDLHTMLPDHAKAIIERLKAQRQEQHETVEDNTAQPKSEAAPAEADTAALQEARQAKTAETLDAGYNVVVDYLERFVSDPKELNLSVTADERQRSPDLADAKDFKRHVFYNAYGELPEFERGLYEFAKERPAFVEAINDWKHFAEKHEAENAKEAARRLIPFVDQYKAERLNHAVLKAADRRIEQAARSLNPRPRTENFTPGAAAADSQTATPQDPESAFLEAALNI